MNAQQKDVQIVDLLRRYPDGTVLFVGGRDTNFPERIRNHSRCVFWGSTDPKTARKNQIPKSVILIVITRFITHALSNQLQKAIKKTGRKIAVINAGGSLGLICESIMNGLADGSAAAAPASGADATPSGPAAEDEKAAVIACLKENANFKAEDAAREVIRLANLVSGRWKMRVNIGVLAGIFYTMRREQESVPDPKRAFDFIRDAGQFFREGLLGAIEAARQAALAEESRLTAFVHELVIDRKRLSQKIQELTNRLKELEGRVAAAVEQERKAKEDFERLASIVRQASAII